MSSRRQRLARTTLVLVTLGATLGSALDAIHSHFGAISYTHPVWAKAAAWVPLLFAGAYGTAIGRPVLAPEEPPLPGWKVALGMGLFIGAYWLTVAPWAWPVRCVLLAVIFVTGWAICDRTKLGLLIAALAAFFGPAVEITLLRAGAFVHHEAQVLGIPLWLPLLYTCASVGLGGLARWLAAPPAARKREPRAAADSSGPSTPRHSARS
jgi:hypothetical protein